LHDTSAHGLNLDMIREKPDELFVDRCKSNYNNNFFIILLLPEPFLHSLPKKDTKKRIVTIFRLSPHTITITQGIPLYLFSTYSTAL
jgi:hypothetical protein